jgi:hypothetical protein
MAGKPFPPPPPPTIKYSTAPTRIVAPPLGNIAFPPNVMLLVVVKIGMVAGKLAGSVAAPAFKAIIPTSIATNIPPINNVFFIIIS